MKSPPSVGTSAAAPVSENSCTRDDILATVATAVAVIAVVLLIISCASISLDFKEGTGYFFRSLTNAEQYAMLVTGLSTAVLAMLIGVLPFYNYVCKR